MKYWSSGRSTRNCFRRRKPRMMNAIATSPCWRTTRPFDSAWRSKETVHLFQLVILSNHRGISIISVQPDTLLRLIHPRNITNTSLAMSTAPAQGKAFTQRRNLSIAAIHQVKQINLPRVETNLPRLEPILLLLMIVLVMHLEESILSRIQKTFKPWEQNNWNWKKNKSQTCKVKLLHTSNR